MLQHLFSKKRTEDVKTEVKHYPYKRILEQLKRLSEEDVVILEKYLQNLQHRRPMLQTSSNINQRTKGSELKTKQQAFKKKRKLEDQIQEATQKMLNHRMISNERRS